MKRSFKHEEVWHIRTAMEIKNNLMQLALLTLAIDRKLRSCDLLSLKVRDVASRDQVFARVQEVTLQASNYLFRSLRRANQPIRYSYNRSIIRSWVEQLGLDSDLYGTYSMQRTKATLIYA